jgi:hypothetical protein
MFLAKKVVHIAYMKGWKGTNEPVTDQKFEPRQNNTKCNLLCPTE